MAVTYRAVASIWILVLGFFAFSRPGTGVDTSVALVASSGLVTAAIFLVVAGMSRKGAAAVTGAHILALADAEYLMRMDSDKG